MEILLKHSHPLSQNVTARLGGKRNALQDWPLENRRVRSLSLYLVQISGFWNLLDEACFLPFLLTRKLQAYSVEPRGKYFRRNERVRCNGEGWKRRKYHWEICAQSNAFGDGNGECISPFSLWFTDFCKLQIHCTQYISPPLHAIQAPGDDGAAMCNVLTHLVKNCTLVYDGCFDATRIG